MTQIELKPWLNADGSEKSNEEIKKICKTWKPSVWEEYLETLERHQEEFPMKPSTLEGAMEKLDPKELARGIFGREEDDLDRFKPLVSRAVRKLTERQYFVLKKIYWHQCTLSQIADELGVTKSAIHKSHKLGLATLDKLLPEMLLEKRLMKSEACSA